MFTLPGRLAALASAALLLGVGAPAALGTSTAQTALTGSIARTSSLGQCDKTYACWLCTGPVDLDQVTVTIDTKIASIDAIKLADGCTGRIGKITVLTESADGVKISSGAHDLEVNGGSITCTDRFGLVHQDGIQAMGGTSITFTGLTVTCPTANHSAFFVNRGTSSDETPVDVLFTRGKLGSTGTTVDLGTSKRSGVVQSAICPSLKVRVPILIPDQPSGDGPAAVKPVDRKNTFLAAC